jgi:uncharacterized protein (AIM24 family)
MKPINRTQDFFSTQTKLQQSELNFALENPYLLSARVGNRLWIKKGTMAAFKGGVRLRREGLFDRGFGLWLKRVTIGEGIKLTKAEGTGEIFLADQGKQITLIELEDESIVINGNNLLMLEDTLAYRIKRLKKISTLVAGGIYSLTLSGVGFFAITTYQQPLCIAVSPTEPVVTDPNCTVGWSSGLEPKISTDQSWNSLLSRSHGDLLRMTFEGEGFVLLQPYEELHFIQKY